LAAAAELPATADPIAARHRHRLPAARHRGAGDNRVGPLPVNFVDALIRQPECDQLADAPVAEVPADRASTLGQKLDYAEIAQRVDL